MFGGIPTLLVCMLIQSVTLGEPKVTALCHCVDCQKVWATIENKLNCTTNTAQWTGSAYTSNAVVTEDSFLVTKGKRFPYQSRSFTLRLN